jgi:KDO2-lipid IV(A) lauroyltransferase
MLKRVPSYVSLFCIYALSLLPLQVLYIFATCLYWMLYYIFGYRRAVVSTNLRNSFPEKSDAEINLIEKRY